MFRFITLSFTLFFSLLLQNSLSDPITEALVRPLVCPMDRSAFVRLVVIVLKSVQTRSGCHSDMFFLSLTFIEILPTFMSPLFNSSHKDIDNGYPNQRWRRQREDTASSPLPTPSPLQLKSEIIPPRMIRRNSVRDLFHCSMPQPTQP